MIDRWAAEARRVRDDVIILDHGGPVARPADAEYSLGNSSLCRDFDAASPMERLPTEIGLTEQTKKCMAIERQKDAAE